MTKRWIYPFTLLTLSSACVTNAAAADWLQFGYDSSHTGHNTAERGFGNGAALYHVSIGFSAEASPIYLSNVTTASGTKNVLYIVTKNGTLLALNAATGAQIWMKRPTPATGLSNLTTGSAAVDPNLLYVYAYGLDGKVHKYAVGDGTETVTGGWPQISVSPMKTAVEKGASGLTIATTPSGNYLYSVTDGYVGDGGDYQGHITSINLATGTQTVFNSNCSDQIVHFEIGGTNCSAKRNGIWGRGGATYDPGTNRIYIATGNGPYNANTASGRNWGDSVLALAVDGTGTGVNGQPRDSYTPASFQGLENADADLGSVSPAIIPAPAGSSIAHLGMQVAKDSCVRLINLDNMSGAGVSGHTGGELHQIALPNGGSNCTTGNDSGGNEVKPQPAVWVNPADSSSWFFVANPAGLTAYKITLAAGIPQSALQWTKGSTDGACSSPVIANSALYCVTGAKVRALNPVTGAVLWSDTAIGGIKWQSPIIVDGHLYILDDASQIHSYALDGIFRNGVE